MTLKWTKKEATKTELAIAHWEAKPNSSCAEIAELVGCSRALALKALHKKRKQDLEPKGEKSEEKLKPIKNPIKELDNQFSRWIRLKAADKSGLCTCYTCGVKRNWKEIQAGHFQSRQKYNTRWDERNVKPQCRRCNMTNSGQQYVFGKRLNQDYGQQTAEQIIEDAKKYPFWLTPDYLVDMAGFYKTQVSQMLADIDAVEIDNPKAHCADE